MPSADFRGILRVVIVATVAAYAGGTTNDAMASGFQLREGSADWMANAFAGDTAKAYDASTVWSNPAGMVRLNQSEIDGSINGIFPSATFSGANFFGPGRPGSGTTGGNLIEPAGNGGIYGVWSMAPDFKLGFGIDSPFGQRVTNPANFVGRYQSLVSSVTDVQIAIAAAYRINEQWSIGIGPVVDIFKARLTQAVNLGVLSGIAGDPVADLHATDVSLGFNVGVLFQATPDLRFGLDYRSRIQHDINGTQTVSVPPLVGLLSPATAAFLAAQNSPASTKITLPDSVTAGFYWQATPQLALLGDLSWTNWSLLKNINVVPANPGAASSSLAENWRDTFAISVGANYNLTQELMLQGGIGFDQSPVTASNRTSRIPDSNRYLIGIGAQYGILPNLTLQVAYAHIFFESAELTSQASATSGVLIGKYTSAADTVGLGVKWRF